jgi:hypothetical protein
MDLLGGAHRDVKGRGGHGHHVYAFASYNNVLNLTRGDGPAIAMSVSDHKLTASYDNIKGAPEYREQQRALLENGQFREAWHRDFKDARANFGNKYDQHFAQAEAHLLKLDSEKKIKLEESFKTEIRERQQLQADLQKAQRGGTNAEIASRKENLKSAYDQALNQKASLHQSTDKGTLQASQPEKEQSRSDTYERARTAIQGNPASLRTSVDHGAASASEEKRPDTQQHGNTYARAHQAIRGYPASPEVIKAVEASYATDHKQQSSSQSQQPQQQSQNNEDQQRGR